MKRKRTAGLPYANSQFKRPRAAGTGQNSTAITRARGGPIRTYPGSMVPTASRGYTPNSVELKAFDNAVGPIQANTTGVITNIFNPVQGTDFNNRIGRKVLLKKIFIRGLCNLEAAGSPATGQLVSAQTARFILFWDAQPNGALATIGDLLVGGGTGTAYSQLNLNNRDRFKVLKDKTYTFDAFGLNTTATQTFGFTGRSMHAIKIFKSVNLESIFVTSGGTIADITSGALCICTIGTIPAGSNTDANFYWQARVRYNDA